MTSEIPTEAIEVAAKAIHRYDVREGISSTYAPNQHHRAEAIAMLEATAPHIQSRAIEKLAEARNDDDTQFVFTWGQRDWMRRLAVDIRTAPTDAI